MHDSWQVYHSQHAQPPILRCGPAWLSHWRFRVQIIALISKDQRVLSFGVIWIRIGDPRSVSSWCIKRTGELIHHQSVFADSFDAPWSRQILDHWSCSRSFQRNAAKITLRLAYNSSDTAIHVICTLLPAEQARALIHSLRQSRPKQKISKVALSHLFAQLPTTTHWTFAGLSALNPHGPPDKCAKPYGAIKWQFLTLI